MDVHLLTPVSKQICRTEENGACSEYRVGFEVLSEVVRRSSVFWDITSSCPLKVNRHFGGTCRLPIQGRRISHARNHHEADPEDGGDMFL
jgi:hypothetical protein